MNYVREIADIFRLHCRHITILDPMDFALIAEWEKQDIPLPVILRSIEEVCSQENDLAIESIADIQDRIKQNFVNWLQTNSMK